MRLLRIVEGKLRVGETGGFRVEVENFHVGRAFLSRLRYAKLSVMSSENGGQREKGGWAGS
jgi:hypothetical protein